MRHARSSNGVTDELQPWLLTCEDNLTFMVSCRTHRSSSSLLLRPTMLASLMNDERRLRATCNRKEKSSPSAFACCTPQARSAGKLGTTWDRGEIVPLDAILYPIFKEHGLKLRNRIVWHFGHGLHCKKRLSGRYETINWFTKCDSYTLQSRSNSRCHPSIPASVISRGQMQASSPVIPRASIPAMCGCFPT